MSISLNIGERPFFPRACKTLERGEDLYQRHLVSRPALVRAKVYHGLFQCPVQHPVFNQLMDLAVFSSSPISPSIRDTTDQRTGSLHPLRSSGISSGMSASRDCTFFVFLPFPFSPCRIHEEECLHHGARPCLPPSLPGSPSCKFPGILRKSNSRS